MDDDTGAPASLKGLTTAEINDRLGSHRTDDVPTPPEPVTDPGAPQE